MGDIGRPIRRIRIEPKPEHIEQPAPKREAPRKEPARPAPPPKAPDKVPAKVGQVTP